MSNYLPISKRDIVTPFNISAEESASLVTTTNNKTSYARRGGFCYSLTMGIRPYNLLVDSQNHKYWDIVTFLNSNPVMYIPIFNMVESQVFTQGAVVTTTSDAAVGATGFTINFDANTTKFRPGEFIKIGSKDKIYQVRSHVSNSLTLSQPLSHNVSNGDRIYYSEQLSLAGHPLDGVRFHGVFGKFINEDFGNPVNRIEDGIIGNIGPLKLKEKL